MGFSAMILAAMIAVLKSSYSNSYCMLSSMGLILGFTIDSTSSYTAIFLTTAKCNPYSSPLLRLSYIPR